MLLVVMVINQCVLMIGLVSLKSYLGEDVVYNFMIEASKYCSHVMKKYFNK